MSEAGKRLIGAAEEALSIAREDVRPADTFIPADIDVRAIRHATKLSQEDFAAVFGFTVSQIRDWEQHRSRPIGGVRAYLMLIEKRPKVMLDLLREMSTDKPDDGEAA